MLSNLIKHLIFIVFCTFSVSTLASSFNELWSKSGGQLLQPSDGKQTNGNRMNLQAADNNPPIEMEITNLEINQSGASAFVTGKVRDMNSVLRLSVDGEDVFLSDEGIFEFKIYTPLGGREIQLVLEGQNGELVVKKIALKRKNSSQAEIEFASLNPLKRKAMPNKDAVALIIGIGTYENVIDAAYADKDALVFRDYATEKLGIPDNQIKLLINNEAEIGEVLLGIRKWVRRSTKPDKTDVYVFFAGHGLATATGEAYILPYDGRPEVDLLDRTALLQKELFAEIDKAKPRNVTIFLDACYTGKARTGEVLMADANYRPIAIRAVDDGMPDNFTLITASSGDEFSGPLEEMKHGLFSYFLMKGMEGEADANKNNEITAGELHTYVQTNVIQQSSGSQTPELQGDATRVLVRFQ
jgi:hypothetical protein